MFYGRVLRPFPPHLTRGMCYAPAMRNDPEKRLIRSLEALARKTPKHLLSTRVYRWRGKKFVVKKKVRVAVFASSDMLGSPVNLHEPIGIYESEFGLR